MSKITDYTALDSPETDDVLVIVDVHDSTMSPQGTTKQITLADLPFTQIAGDLGGTTSDPEVISTHLTDPLPLAQGGTGQDAGSAAALLTALGAAPLASPALTGTPTAPTASALTDTTQVATTAYADGAVAVETSRAETAEALLAPKASPALTGSPTAPTQTSGDSSTKIATDAFVATAVATETSRAETAEALLAPKASPTFTGTPAAPTASALTDSTQVATTAYADSAVAVETTRAETAEALKLAKASNLSDVANAATALANLGLPTPTAANQLPVSNSSDQWTLSQAGTVGGSTYNSSWNVAAGDLGGEALYNSSSAGTATIPSGLTTVIGATVAFRQLGTGNLTVAAGSDVTVEGVLATSGQYQTLLARQVATDTWAVTGSVSLASPALTGTPTAPTAAISDASTQLATDGFVSSLLVAGSANQFGWLGWTIDPLLAAGGFRPQSGYLCLMRFRAAATGTIGHIDYCILASGSGLTTAENWLGIYDTGQTTAGSATLIGYTADQTTNFATSGVLSATIATGTPAVTAGQDYFAAILINGSTRPQFTCGASNATQMPLVNQGLSGLSLRLANGSGTPTTLPSAITAGNLSGTSASDLAALSFVMTT